MLLTVPLTVPSLRLVVIVVIVVVAQIQMRELFRLADPDHSKSIDPAEFRAFLSDLQNLENEPDQLSR